MQMAVCRFCLCRIDPTKVQVATYVQGTHTRRRIRVARDRYYYTEGV